MRARRRDREHVSGQHDDGARAQHGGNGSGNRNGNRSGGGGGGRSGGGGGGNNRKRRNRNNRNRKDRNKGGGGRGQTPSGAGFWGDASRLPAPTADVRITDDPAAVARSLGSPPLPGPEKIAEHYFTVVYERAVQTAGALAAAGGLIDPNALAEEMGE